MLLQIVVSFIWEGDALLLVPMLEPEEPSHRDTVNCLPQRMRIQHAFCHHACLECTC